MSIKVQRLKLEVRLKEMQLNLERYNLRFAELEEEKKKLEVNFEATKLELKKIQNELDKIPLED